MTYITHHTLSGPTPRPILIHSAGALAPATRFIHIWAHIERAPLDDEWCGAPSRTGGAAPSRHLQQASSAGKVPAWLQARRAAEAHDAEVRECVRAVAEMWPGRTRMDVVRGREVACRRVIGLSPSEMGSERSGRVTTSSKLYMSCSPQTWCDTEQQRTMQRTGHENGALRHLTSGAARSGCWLVVRLVVTRARFMLLISFLSNGCLG